MFEVREPGCGYYIKEMDGSAKFLHSDGAIFHTVEYFPTEADAQAVLDKFYPKPEHVWEHGDVFESGHRSNPGIMMYIHLNKGGSIRLPVQVIYLEDDTYVFDLPEAYLKGAKFLFNVKEKI